jgi:hypothetical protein
MNQAETNRREQTAFLHEGTAETLGVCRYTIQSNDRQGVTTPPISITPSIRNLSSRGPEARRAGKLWRMESPDAALLLDPLTR